jgi:pyruvate/2-oxoacid:ferredoxin oxidoreductase beta subunit
MEVATAKPRAGKSRRLSGVGGSGRRLSAGWRAEDAENFLEENDDESERVAAANQKREEAENLAKKTRSPYKETPNRKARTAVLTDMYADAIQMCAENVRRRRRAPHLARVARA